MALLPSPSPTQFTPSSLLYPELKERETRGDAAMAQLLQLPDFAVARSRGRAVSAAAGERRVIRVADPVRAGRLLPVPPLLSAPVTPSASPSAATRREEEKRRYYLNMGYAIRTLREELPDALYKEPSFDIFRSVCSALLIRRPRRLITTLIDPFDLSPLRWNLESVGINGTRLVFPTNACFSVDC
jgi:hypothetical protein